VVRYDLPVLGGKCCSLAYATAIYCAAFGLFVGSWAGDPALHSAALLSHRLASAHFRLQALGLLC
ncbi:hypothetical protein LCGC14_1821320, partial [marine sediment metagenome]